MASVNPLKKVHPARCWFVYQIFTVAGANGTTMVEVFVGWLTRVVNHIYVCMIRCFTYKFNRSLELSLLPYVEMYRSSTYFFCAPQLTTPTVLVGSWWPGGLLIPALPVLV